MQESTKTRFLSDGQCSCMPMGAVTATFGCRKAIRSEFLRKAKHARTVGPRKQDTSR